MIVFELWFHQFYLRLTYVVLLPLCAIFWLSGWAWAASIASAFRGAYDGRLFRDDDLDKYGDSMAACAALGAFTWSVFSAHLLLSSSKNPLLTFIPSQGRHRRRLHLLHHCLSARQRAHPPPGRDGHADQAQYRSRDRRQCPWWLQSADSGLLRRPVSSSTRHEPVPTAAATGSIRHTGDAIAGAFPGAAGWRTLSG